MGGRDHNSMEYVNIYSTHVCTNFSSLTITVFSFPLMDDLNHFLFFSFMYILYSTVGSAPSPQVLSKFP
jgi:hypothetical protein